MTADRSSPLTERTFHRLLGTVVHVRVHGVDERVASLAIDAVEQEIRRLERVFSVHDPTSELCRWRRGELADDLLGTELRWALAAAHDWHVRSRGTCHPSVGALLARWRRAESEGALPADDELARWVSTATMLPFEVVRTSGAPTIDRTGDCSGVDLNAIAKGRIVDLAVEAAWAAALADDGVGLDDVMVNAGGDLRHRGAGSIRVGIEDPRRPFDNVAPLLRVSIGDEALATSGSSRRGFRVGTRWFGHIVDPRTGWPVETAASTSVIAPDAATADVVATLVGVSDPATRESVLEAAFDGTATSTDPIGWCVIDRDGHITRNAAWLQREIRPSSRR